MYRVILPITLLLPLAGCGTNSTTLTAGFAGTSIERSSVDLGDGPAGSYGTASGKSKAKAGRKATRSSKKSGRRYASRGDLAPSGSWERAPRGVFGDRNYAETRLDPEQARRMINKYRRKNGLKPLKLNSKLTRAAKAHSRDLSKWDRISHYGSDGSDPWARVDRTGYHAKLAAENVGTGQATFKEVFKGWRESKGHNKNLLLPDARHMGIALVRAPKSEFKTFWTLVLGASSDN